MGIYGRRWTKVADVVGTRTTVQVRSHAQKWEIKSGCKPEPDGAPPEKPFHSPPRELPSPRGDSVKRQRSAPKPFMPPPPPPRSGGSGGGGGGGGGGGSRAVPSIARVGSGDDPLLREPMPHDTSLAAWDIAGSVREGPNAASGRLRSLGLPQSLAVLCFRSTHDHHTQTLRDHYNHRAAFLFRRWRLLTRRGTLRRT